jgi:hypothetical protein
VFTVLPWTYWVFLFSFFKKKIIFVVTGVKKKLGRPRFYFCRAIMLYPKTNKIKNSKALKFFGGVNDKHASAPGPYYKEHHPQQQVW